MLTFEPPDRHHCRFSQHGTLVTSFPREHVWTATRLLLNYYPAGKRNKKEALEKKKSTVKIDERMKKKKKKISNINNRFWSSLLKGRRNNVALFLPIERGFFLFLFFLFPMGSVCPKSIRLDGREQSFMSRDWPRDFMLFFFVYYFLVWLLYPPRFGFSLPFWTICSL